jgi:hypothetical protein
MPRSFVEQACARCSVEGARLWFNCNPEGPRHWFYEAWISQAAARNALYLHFTMEDNPALSQKVRPRYERRYSGVFYRRFSRGAWAAAEGGSTIFSARKHTPGSRRASRLERYCISCDTGRSTRVLRPVGSAQRSLVPDPGILPRRPAGGLPEDRSGVRGGLRKTRGRKAHRDRGRRPLRRELHRGAAAARLAGQSGGKRTCSPAIRITADLLRRASL